MKYPLPKKEVYWYTTRALKPTPLDRDIEVDVIIVGGGMAGLMCAQRLKRENKNLRIGIVEATFCGGGASGKSSGFITPDSELELCDLVGNYGEEEGKRLWEFSKSGVAAIRSTIERLNLKCDFSEQDALFIANSKGGFEKVVEEYKTQIKQGYQSWLYDSHRVQKIIGSAGYEGAVRGTNTFGMNAYLYCQELKDALGREGVLIFEQTPVDEILPTGVRANGFIVSAEKIVVCTDRFLPDFNLAKDHIYHAQTFLAVSKPLSQTTINNIFPVGPMMVWDTDLIYQYYRIIEGNRLIVGAASLIYTYAENPTHFSRRVLTKMYKYIQHKFPRLAPALEFEYFWPGLIGVSKDFLPIAGRDPLYKNIYYAGAGAGLPWAAGLGEYLADKILIGRDDFDEAFSPQRAFPIGERGQVILRKPVSFAICHGIKKYLT